MTKCKAITQSGTQCKLNASPTGYCHIHDPERIVQRESESQPSEMPKQWFSQRKGHKPIATTLQVKDITDDLRISLWNALRTHSLQVSRMPLQGLIDIDWDYGFGAFAVDLWSTFYKEPVDTIARNNLSIVEDIHKRFMTCEWHEVYDFIEYTLNYMNDSQEIEAVNRVLERELSAYRFVGRCITDITDKQEIEMLESTLIDDEFSGVTTHLRQALALMSNRNDPDYRNSIKESISAVESLARTMTGQPNATLGSALKTLGKNNMIHKALKESFLKLYGYTSDAEGIRHALLDEPNLTAADAKFFLLSCTSFINYLKSKM